MRFLPLALGALSLAGSASAQYFSEGWKPGKPVSKGATGFTYQPAPTGVTTESSTEGSSRATGPSKGLLSLFSLESLLQTAPVQALFGRAGVNITEKLEAARAHSSIWDERIPLLTDENYEDLVV